MKFKDFLKASKKVIEPGSWTSGKPTKTLLDLSKGKFRLGAQWTWRKIVLEAEQRAFHIVIAFHEGKEEYVAHLAHPLGNDSLVLASIENHGTHPGWHLHVNCGGEGGSNVGRLRYPSQYRVPGEKQVHRHRKMPITQEAALEPVMVFFRVNMGGNDDNGNLSLW